MSQVILLCTLAVTVQSSRHLELMQIMVYLQLVAMLELGRVGEASPRKMETSRVGQGATHKLSHSQVEPLTTENEMD
eukprot:SAG31_NODE_13_length_37961_cov_21.751307_7_plen_77_part_00